MTLFPLKLENLENFAAEATQQAMKFHRRMKQKRNDVIESSPLLKKMTEKITAFDLSMTSKLGKKYTKVRDISLGLGKLYVAGQFGSLGMATLGAVHTAQAMKPLLKNAEEERKKGKVSGLFGYMKKHPQETKKALTDTALGTGAFIFGLSGMINGGFVTRAAATALVAIPEMNALKETFKDVIDGRKTAKQALKDLGNDFLTVGKKALSFVADDKTETKGKSLHQALTDINKEQTALRNVQTKLFQNGQRGL